MLIKVTKAVFSTLGAVCVIFMVGIAGSGDTGRMALDEVAIYEIISAIGFIASIVGHRCTDLIGKRLDGYEIRRDR